MFYNIDCINTLIKLLIIPQGLTTVNILGYLNLKTSLLIGDNDGNDIVINVAKILFQFFNFDFNHFHLP